HPGVLYTDNGFWDTYRTEYPLLALILPERLTEILQGWVNALKEGGWFPQWATPGYRACMVGTHIDAVIADAVSRGITGFDVEAAVEGMLRHAYHPGDPDGAWGRIGIEDYIRLGYVPADRHHESVARTLDYAYDDWCIARVLRHLGRDAEAEALEVRSQNYRNLWDPEVGFMRGRNADGSWLQPWREFRWGDPYVEGGPWQSTWAVPHDPQGLAELMGGPEALVAKLDRMLTTPPRFEIGVYGMEIHEMTEMACADPEGQARGEGFGQYAHSNQPVHNALWLYSEMGRPDRTATEVHRVLDRLYTPDDLPGDEDNGEMGAWYVLSALGLFPACPGDGNWTLSQPLVARATIALENGQSIVIEAPDVSEGTDSSDATWREAALGGLTITQVGIVEGGTLRFG
ncbi:glycoside hydrolase family 92 protein, partial [bacterium]